MLRIMLDIDKGLLFDVTLYLYSIFIFNFGFVLLDVWWLSQTLILIGLGCYSVLNLEEEYDGYLWLWILQI